MSEDDRKKRLGYYTRGARGVLEEFRQRVSEDGAAILEAREVTALLSDVDDVLGRLAELERRLGA